MSNNSNIVLILLPINNFGSLEMYVVQRNQSLTGMIWCMQNKVVRARYLTKRNMRRFESSNVSGEFTATEIIRYWTNLMNTLDYWNITTWSKANGRGKFIFLSNKFTWSRYHDDLNNENWFTNEMIKPSHCILNIEWNWWVTVFWMQMLWMIGTRMFICFDFHSNGINTWHPNTINLVGFVK